MADINPQDIEKTIKAIQNIAIMLTGATEFVCETRMLKSLSRDIEANLKRLEDDIASLKKDFSGKLPETLEPDSSLSRIGDIAKIIKGDNADIEAKCRAGDLGNELTISITELKGIVRSIRGTVRGEVSGYTFADRIEGYSGRIKSFLLDFSPLVSITGKVIAAMILVAIFSFVYLFLTMESEDPLLESLKNDLAYTETQRDTLEKNRQEYAEISEKLKALDQRKLNRQDKIELLNLSMKERKMNEFIEKTILSIEIKEKQIVEKNKKVEEIRKKSFFQKLFKR